MRSAPSSDSVVVYEGAVTRADVDVGESELEGVLTRLCPLFYRTESRKHAEQYFRGTSAADRTEERVGNRRMQTSIRREQMYVNCCLRQLLHRYGVA